MASTPKTAKDVLAFAKERGTQMVSLRFIDFIGRWRHFAVPLHELNEGVFEEGLGFDGSSIKGWLEIHNSDMLVMPDPNTAVMDPFTNVPTLVLLCNVSDPITKELYQRDPRNIAARAEQYLKSTGIADTAYFGPEAEFFIFDGVRYSTDPHHMFFEVDSIEGAWNAGREEPGGNLGYKPGYKDGYNAVMPTDAHNDMRDETSASTRW
jgi:glutamine synthetase